MMEMPNWTSEYFKRNLSLERLRARIRRTIRMVRVSDETAQCFRNEPFVNQCHSILHRRVDPAHHPRCKVVYVSILLVRLSWKTRKRSNGMQSPRRDHDPGGVRPCL